MGDAKNHLASLSKGKEGSSYLVKDIGEIIYNSEKIDSNIFVEK